MFRNHQSNKSLWDYVLNTNEIINDIDNLTKNITLSFYKEPVINTSNIVSVGIVRILISSPLAVFIPPQTFLGPGYLRTSILNNIKISKYKNAVVANGLNEVRDSILDAFKTVCVDILNDLFTPLRAFIQLNNFARYTTGNITRIPYFFIHYLLTCPSLDYRIYSELRSFVSSTADSYHTAVDIQSVFFKFYDILKKNLRCYSNMGYFLSGDVNLYSDDFLVILQESTRFVILVENIDTLISSLSSDPGYTFSHIEFEKGDTLHYFRCDTTQHAISWVYRGLLEDAGVFGENKRTVESCVMFGSPILTTRAHILTVLTNSQVLSLKSNLTYQNIEMVFSELYYSFEKRLSESYKVDSSCFLQATDAYYLRIMGLVSNSTKVFYEDDISPMIDNKFDRVNLPEVLGKSFYDLNSSTYGHSSTTEIPSYRRFNYLLPPRFTTSMTGKFTSTNPIDEPLKYITSQAYPIDYKPIVKLDISEAFLSCSSVIFDILNAEFYIDKTSTITPDSFLFTKPGNTIFSRKEISSLRSAEGPINAFLPYSISKSNCGYSIDKSISKKMVTTVQTFRVGSEYNYLSRICPSLNVTSIQSKAKDTVHFYVLSQLLFSSNLRPDLHIAESIVYLKMKYIRENHDALIFTLSSIYDWFLAYDALSSMPASCLKVIQFACHGIIIKYYENEYGKEKKVLDYKKITFALLGAIREPASIILQNAGFSCYCTGLNAFSPNISADILTSPTAHSTIVISDMDQVSTDVVSSYVEAESFIYNVVSMFRSSYVYFKLNLPCPNAVDKLLSDEARLEDYAGTTTHDIFKRERTKYYTSSVSSSQYGTELFLCCDIPYKIKNIARSLSGSSLFPNNLLPYHWCDNRILTNYTHDQSDSTYFYTLTSGDPVLVSSLVSGTTSYVGNNSQGGDFLTANFRSTTNQRVLLSYYGAELINFDKYKIANRTTKVPHIQFSNAGPFSGIMSAFDAALYLRIDIILKNYIKVVNTHSKLFFIDVGGRDETALPFLHKYITEYNSILQKKSFHPSIRYLNVEPNPPPTAAYVFRGRNDDPVSFPNDHPEKPMQDILDFTGSLHVSYNVKPGYKNDCYIVYIYRNSFPTVFIPSIYNVRQERSGVIDHFLDVLEGYNHNFMERLINQDKFIFSDNQIEAEDRIVYTDYNIFTIANYYTSRYSLPATGIIDTVEDDRMDTLTVLTPSYNIQPVLPRVYASGQEKPQLENDAENPQLPRQYYPFVTSSFPNDTYSYNCTYYNHRSFLHTLGSSGPLNKQLRRQGLLVNRISQLHTTILSTVSQFIVSPVQYVAKIRDF